MLYVLDHREFPSESISAAATRYVMTILLIKYLHLWSRLPFAGNPAFLVAQERFRSESTDASLSLLMKQLVLSALLCDRVIDKVYGATLWGGKPAGYLCTCV